MAGLITGVGGAHRPAAELRQSQNHNHAQGWISRPPQWWDGRHPGPQVQLPGDAGKAPRAKTPEGNHPGCDVPPWEKAPPRLFMPGKKMSNFKQVFRIPPALPAVPRAQPAEKVRSTSCEPRLLRGYMQGITQLIESRGEQPPRGVTPPIPSKAARHGWLAPNARQGRYSPTWNSEMMDQQFGGSMCAESNYHLPAQGAVVLQSRDNRGPPLRKLTSREQQRNMNTVPECSKGVDHRQLAATISEPLTNRFVNKRMVEREVDQAMPWSSRGGHWYTGGKITMPQKRKLPVPGAAKWRGELGCSLPSCRSFAETTAVYAANGDCFSRHAFKRK